jgi:hypothetical protein
MKVMKSERKGEISLNMAGRVTVTLKKGKEKETLEKKNNIDISYASTIGALLLFGTNSPYAGVYASTFSLPQGIVILLINNGAVVSQIQTSLQGLTDTLNTAGETTTITFIGSDATTSQYKFDKLELYTVVNSALFLKIAEVSLQTPITKGQNDQVQVTWEIVVVSSVPFANINTISQSECQSTCPQPGECSSNAVGSQNMVSVFNFLASVLLVPNLFQILQNQKVPMSFFASGMTTVTTVSGVVQVGFFDACLNSAGLWNPVTDKVASASETFDQNYVYVALNVVFQPTAEVTYIMPFVQITGEGTGFIYPIAFIAVQGTSIPNQSQIFGILLKIPYGPSTLVSLSESS